MARRLVKRLNLGEESFDEIGEPPLSVGALAGAP
jgi:hypothetical protein